MAEGSSTIGISWSPKVSFAPCGRKNRSGASENLPQLSTFKNGNELVDGLFLPPSDPRKLNKFLKKNMKDTTGKNWFNMPTPTITPNLKRDLETLKVGTVMESTSDFYSSRLTKKERKQTIADELLSDPSFKAYRKRKVQQIGDALRPAGVDKWKIRGRQTLKRAKDRRELRHQR